MKGEEPARRRSTVWIALLLLLGSIYLFWILPFQLGRRPVQVEFTPAPGQQSTPEPPPPSVP